MAKKDLPTPEMLRNLLRYDPDTGMLFWRERTASFFDGRTQDKPSRAAGWNKQYAGKEALTARCSAGYKHGSVCQKSLLAHRVVWAVYWGAWPNHSIDHVNGDTGDNRIQNLREVTHQENMKNQKKSVANKSGVTGVHFDSASKKWRAGIQVNGRNIKLGRFLNLEDAIEARKNAEEKYGFHQNHGRVNTT